jgi:hypothetical protein
MQMLTNLQNEGENMEQYQVFMQYRPKSYLIRPGLVNNIYDDQTIAFEALKEKLRDKFKSLKLDRYKFNRFSKYGKIK